jgi:hypothetical protein
MDLVGLVKELERQKANSLDLIVDGRTLKTVPDRAEGVRLAIPEKGEYPLTEWAHLQLAEKLQIPKKYYDRMRFQGKNWLLAENINAWLPEKERRLIRILDGRIRAILSDRYRIMDNYDVLFLALEEFKNRETVEVYRADLTETMFYLKAIDRGLTAEVRDKDVVRGGLIIRNSEVGASAFKVEPFVLRKICMNGLIGEHSLKKIHLGRQTLETGEIDWSDETRELEDRALWAKIRDIIKATFDGKIFGYWVEKLKESTEIEVEKPKVAVENLVKFYGLSQEQRDFLLMHFSEKTKYGLVDVVTTLAREAGNVDEQVRLEEVGGKILDTPESEFERLFNKGD